MPEAEMVLAIWKNRIIPIYSIKNVEFRDMYPEGVLAAMIWTLNYWLRYGTLWSA